MCHRLLSYQRRRDGEREGARDGDGRVEGQERGKRKERGERVCIGRSGYLSISPL